MFRIYFSDIGEAKICYDMVVDAETLEDAENTVLFRLRRYLFSSKVMLTHIGDMIYEVNVGLRCAGRVKIRSL